MRFASVRPEDLGIITDNDLILIREVLGREGSLPNGATMVDLITRYDSLKPSLEKALTEGHRVNLVPGRLKAPVERPSKIWGAASNYRRGSRELGRGKGWGTAQAYTPEDILEMIFLKPPSSVIGPGENIVIPRGADTVFPELELGIVVGREGKDLSRDQAMEVVFGYTIILDVTARGYGSGERLPASRCVRKGFDTFAPLGPWIVTRDEIPDPQKLQMRLWVNGELRQSASTDAMINGVVDLVSYLSSVSTLVPGDIIATGNPDAPAFQKQLVAGDSLKAEIEGIGELSLGVKRAEEN